MLQKKWIRKNPIQTDIKRTRRLKIAKDNENIPRVISKRTE